MKIVSIDGKRAKVKGVLLSARYALVNGNKMKIYRQKQVLKELGISKPTFKKFLDAGYLLKVWPDGVDRTGRDYWISEYSLEKTRAMMIKGWKPGQSLIKTDAPKSKKKS